MLPMWFVMFFLAFASPTKPVARRQKKLRFSNPGSRQAAEAALSRVAISTKLDEIDAQIGDIDDPDGDYSSRDQSLPLAQSPLPAASSVSKPAGLVRHTEAVGLATNREGVARSTEKGAKLDEMSTLASERLAAVTASPTVVQGFLPGAKLDEMSTPASERLAAVTASPTVVHSGKIAGVAAARARNESPTTSAKLAETSVQPAHTDATGGARAMLYPALTVLTDASAAAPPAATSERAGDANSAQRVESTTGSINNGWMDTVLAKTSKHALGLHGTDLRFGDSKLAAFAETREVLIETKVAPVDPGATTAAPAAPVVISDETSSPGISLVALVITLLLCMLLIFMLFGVVKGLHIASSPAEVTSTRSGRSQHRSSAENNSRRTYRDRRSARMSSDRGGPGSRESSDNLGATSEQRAPSPH